MITKVRSIVKGFFIDGHERTIKAKKNIAFSFLLKGLSIAIGLILIPMTISYVNPTQYGIWLTLSSIISWFSFFDVGLGHGLKNKLVQVIQAENFELAKIYVSTTYFAIGIISLVIFFSFLIANTFLNWADILNTPFSFAHELSLVAIIVFFIFCLQFVLQLINIISIANQNTILPGLIIFLGNVMALAIIISLSLYKVKGSLMILCMSIGISPLVILLIFNFILFNGKFKMFSPSYKFFKISYIKDILQVGLKFFVIQIGLLFFYNIDNILISHIVGPSAVTSYNIAYKYFGVITIISGIIMTPFWTAFGEAHLRKDYDWIKASVKKLEKTVLYIFGISLLMILCSSYIYKIWIGDKIIIPLSLSVVLCVYTVFNTYRTIFVYYLNGVGKLNIQLLLILAAGLINIPLGILLGKYFGATGVIMATTILCIGCGIIEITQYKKIISGTAKGIWNR